MEIICMSAIRRSNKNVIFDCNFFRKNLNKTCHIARGNGKSLMKSGNEKGFPLTTNVQFYYKPVVEALSAT